MNNSEFTYILQNPQSITDAQTDALQQLTVEYPYFQSARGLVPQRVKTQGELQIQPRI